MENKNLVRGINITTLVLTIVTLLLSIFYNSAFIPSCMIMLSLFVFSICYAYRDRRNLMYTLFTLGILLIIGSLVYTFIRLN